MMRERILRVFGPAMLMLLTLGVTVGQARVVRAAENPQEQSKAATAGSGETVAAANKPTDSQTADMRADLQRMKVLVEQMQMNLGFVQNLNTPLRHQFELEIEMWQMLVKQMERRLDNMGGKPAQ